MAIKIVNTKAPMTFSIEEKFEAGVALLGSEVKAVRAGHADLAGSHVRITGSEAYMVNSKIFPYKFSRIENYEESRTRKLLLHKKEILTLKTRLDTGNYTIVPLSMYSSKNIIKVEIGLAKGKKQYDRRREIKKREQDREIARMLKK